MKLKKVIMLSKSDENFYQEFRDTIQASQKTGVPRNTIYSQCLYNKKGKNDYYFRYKQQEYWNARRIVELDKNGNIINEYATQKDVAYAKDIHFTTVNAILKGRQKGRNCILMYKDEYEKLHKEEKEEKVEEEIVEKKTISKPKTIEYYINVLVGLANQTLVDGAIYNLDGTMLKYSKQDNALKQGDITFFTFEKMWKEVSIELPILLPKEKEFLSNLLKAFTNVKGIVKCKDRRNGYEFIRIETNNQEDTITLPSFVEGKYYKQLTLNTLYSIEDLEL